MNRLWHKQQNPYLIVYFAGWGTPPSAVNHLALPENHDLLICYDYQDLHLDVDFSAYQGIRVVAWSMGVWVAERIFAGIPLLSATAINGTGKPYDDQFGIPRAIFDGTLTNLTEITRHKFERRMCAKLLPYYQSLQGQRSLANIHAELTALFHAIQQDQRTDLFPWSKAIIAEQDKIFPTTHQQAYWQPRCAVNVIEGEHYCLPQFHHWAQLWE